MNYYNYPKYLKTLLTSIDNGKFDRFSHDQRRLRIHTYRRLFYKAYLLLYCGKERAFQMVDLLTPPWYHEGYDDLLD